MTVDALRVGAAAVGRHAALLVLLRAAAGGRHAREASVDLTAEAAAALVAGGARVAVGLAGIEHPEAAQVVRGQLLSVEVERRVARVLARRG